MSTETLVILKDIPSDTDSPEMQIALQCAPVLMKRKVSNLLIVDKKCEPRVTKLFKNSGLDTLKLDSRGGRITFLVYNRAAAWKYIMQDSIREFLKDEGYDTSGFKNILKCLVKRYGAVSREKNSFPHEIGVFLGYPLDDVKGFIENKGRGYVASGYWKVYTEPERKKKIFRNYDKATDTVLRKMRDGLAMEEIISSAYNKSDLMPAFIK